MSWRRRASGGSSMACFSISSLLISLLRLACIVGSSPAFPLRLSSPDNSQNVRSVNVSSTVNRSEVFPIPDSNLALKFWEFGSAVNPWNLESILLVSGAYLQEQIKLYGEMAHPLHGRLEYDLGEGLEILITKMAQAPDELNWSQLQDAIAGLWAYTVTGMRYRAVTFGILDVEDDVQIGWGHIVKQDDLSLSSKNTKRELEIITPALPPSANSISGKNNNSNLPDILGSVDWHIEDSDMTLRFSPRGPYLDEEALKNLLVVTIEIVQNAIKAKGKDALLGNSFRYGRLVVLEVINEPHVLTWEQLGFVVLGLVEFMIDHRHYRSTYFTIYSGDPLVELAIGQIGKGLVPHDNITVARRDTAKRDEACECY